MKSSLSNVKIRPERYSAYKYDKFSNSMKMPLAKEEHRRRWYACIFTSCEFRTAHHRFNSGRPHMMRFCSANLSVPTDVEAARFFVATSLRSSYAKIRLASIQGFHLTDCEEL